MTTEKFTLFYNGPFSQWHRSPFVLNGIKYETAEMYMMWFKDQVFGGKLEKSILASTHPSETKDLGRQIKGFDESIWRAVAKHGVYKGNMAKFTQNEPLLQNLYATMGTTLVEASPYDTIWGIGLSENDPLALNRSKWKGTNWLGEVLTDLRNDLAIVSNSPYFQQWGLGK